MNQYIAGLRRAEQIIDAMVSSGEWEGQYSVAFIATFVQELDLEIDTERHEDAAYRRRGYDAG